MDMYQFIQIIQTFFSQIPINILDIIIVVVIIYYAIEGYSLGFILAFSDLLGFVFSFFFALKSYVYFAEFLATYFSLPIGFAHAVAFFLIAFISEIVINILFRLLFRYFPVYNPPRRFFYFFRSIDHWAGVIPGVISAFVVLAFLLTVIVSLPSSPFVKKLVTGSEIGSILIANTSMFERRLNDIFGGALNETLNYLTVEPQSDEVVDLRFKTDGAVNEEEEEEMLIEINKERQAYGLIALRMDDDLRGLARGHSEDMFTRGYFSHYTPEGLSPFDRMNGAKIEYTYGGENLALAPSARLAMQGLLNSPGHRANILNPNFERVGIGAIDGGVYGIMFSQEFTN